MQFSSPVYIFIFLPIAVCVYFLLNSWRRYSSGRAFLVCASLFFYGYASVQYLPLLLGSIGVNYLSGKLLNRRRGSGKKVLAFGIVFNVFLLGFFKYCNFFLDNLNLLGAISLPLLKFGLPLAISFYTFQQITYLVDIYRGASFEPDLLDYCFYVLFFAQLVAGPIVRYHELMPQYLDKANRHLHWQNMATGIFVFALGLFKKVVIADTFAMLADVGFRAWKTLSVLESWGTSLSYTFQIYFDFSGYSDMAIGAALLFNLRLPVNFDSPYKAFSVQDFWRRWHITLSRWLRDYLYIPMGGNRKGFGRTMINIVITFLLAGLWHGAGWTFIAWGGMHGAALAVQRVWKRIGGRMPFGIGLLLTFLFLNVSWVFFRAGRLKQALEIVQTMFGMNGRQFFRQGNTIFTGFVPWDFMNLSGLSHSVQSTVDWIGYGIIILFSLLVFVLPNSMQLVNFVPYNGRLLFRTNFLYAVLTAVILFVSFLAFLGNVEQSTFLYFSF